MFRCWPKRAALASLLSRIEPPAPPRRHFTKSWDERARRLAGAGHGQGASAEEDAPQATAPETALETADPPACED